MDARPLGQPSKGLDHRIEGWSQKRRVVAAVAGAMMEPKGTPEASTAAERLMPCFLLSTGLLPSARGLSDAAVDGHVQVIETDETVVGCECYFPQSLHRPELDPFVAALLVQRGGRASLIGDPAVGAAEDQYLHQLLEDHPVGDWWPMAAERMVDFSLGQQGAELLSDGIEDVRW